MEGHEVISFPRKKNKEIKFRNYIFIVCVFLFFFYIYNQIQRPKVRACAIVMSSSASWMVSAYQRSGSVTGTRTAKMDPMNTTPVLPSPASPGISSVPTSSASHQAGSATVKTTAGTRVMKWTVQRLHLAALLSSGCAPPTRCASTWTRCATTKKTALTVLMSQNSAVSSNMSCLTIRVLCRGRPLNPT